MSGKSSPLGRILLIILAVVIRGGCTAYRAGAARPAMPYVVTGATELTVTPLSPGARLIGYRAPATWYTEVEQRLEAAGWTSPDTVAYAPLNRSFGRATPLGVAVVWEWAFLSFDPLQPDVAHIRVQRTIDVPWWRQLRRLVVGTRRAVVPLLP